MQNIQISLTSAWQPVYLRDGVEYQFPMAISPYMRVKIRIPAVFKWDIYQPRRRQEAGLYRRSQELCPNGFTVTLIPGPPNWPIKKSMPISEVPERKLGIRLEICLSRKSASVRPYSKRPL
jgi:hypothetical protein